MLPLVLASSSTYRRELLQRLRLPFTCYSPEIDEKIRQNEPAGELVRNRSTTGSQWPQRELSDRTCVTQ